MQRLGLVAIMLPQLLVPLEQEQQASSDPL